ncbi:AAA family ATPase [Kribbella italica]|uniref:DNA-binding CsgD family transcriptional regulator n=1 Tax=Kribbella italica TaxID=1540520 RepID=A0A7W9J5H6_9ACTN|nr:DNA-binding CsgD family transcriptional regulator [Kribbella italica]
MRTASGDRPERLRLVGRERETRMVRAALAAAPSLVLVVGEAGTGKSRLVAEVARDHPARWLTGQCHPVQDQAPLAPVLEALAPVLDARPGTGTPWRGELVPGMRHSVFARVTEVLGSLGPAVLFVEDLQWADRGTLQLLRFLASRLPREVRLVGTYRPEDLRSAGEITALAGCVRAGTRTTEVRVQPLPAVAVREMATQLLRVESLPEALTGELFERTGGLPFVVEEFLRDMAVGPDGLVSAVERALAETRAPVALRASVTIKLEQVPEACRRVVWAAAVLDSPASDSLIGAVAEVHGMELTEAVDVGLARGLLGQVRPGLYDLRHALAQRAVYETIPSDELRRLHRRAAEALAAREPGAHARIADHSRRGGLIDVWLAQAELAAGQLVAAGEAESAISQLLEMLRVEVLPWADQARLATRLGHAAVESSLWSEAVVAIRMVLDEALEPSADRGRLRLALGVLLHDRAGEFGTARRELAAAVAELADDPASAAWAMSALAVPTSGMEEIAEHRAWMHRATRLLGETGDGVLRGEQGRLVGGGRGVGDDGRAGEDLRGGQTSSTPWSNSRGGGVSSDGVARVMVRRNRGRLGVALGDLSDLDESSYSARGLLWLGHDRRSAALPAGVGTRLWQAWLAGDWALLPERLLRARAVGESAPLVQAELDLVGGRMRLAQGDVAGAKELLLSVGGELPVRAAALATVGRLQLAAEQGGAALEAMEEFLEVVRRKDGWAWASEFVATTCLALDAIGRRDDAVGLLTEFEAGLVGRDAPASVAAGKLVRAFVVGDLGFDEAAAAYRAIGRPYDECLALEEKARRALDAGDSAQLVALASTYEKFGARWDARRCRDALRDAGVAVTTRRGRRGYGNALSPRETEVARLAARGFSNSRIAAELSVSVSTVEDHLTNAMRKLKIRSRRDLGPLVDP